MQDFKELNLPASLARSLDQMKYTTPTPIQAQAIPLAMEGRDIMGSAQTGTGKTAAFAIPIIAKLLANPRGTALILSPTRELATQILDIMQKLLANNREIKTALLIGGDSMPKQIAMLRARPRLIVGTPGRINDHLARGGLMLHDVGILVLDETDRMLDMGFSVQLDAILKFLPAKRQTLMFSATLPPNIVAISKKYLNNPERIAVGSTTTAITAIKQEVIHLPHAEKYGRLVQELGKRQGSIIIFVRTKRGADRLAEKLTGQNHSADAIHGDLQQRQRDRVIAAFRNKQHRIMVATDIAARGLDIPHIEHVINFDLPQCPEDYIHRIGRTARAGAEGSAICFVSPDEIEKWDAIERMQNPGAPRTARPPQQGKGNSKGKRFGSSHRPAGSGGPGKKQSGSNDWKRRRHGASKPAGAAA